MRACIVPLVSMIVAMPIGGQALPVTSVDAATLPRLATVSERYQSYNVEMAEVIGGNFWKPYDASTLAALRAKAAAPSGAGASGGTSPAKVGVDTSIYQPRPPIETHECAAAHARGGAGADILPELRGVQVAAGPMTFAPSTITFIAVPSAGNPACR